MTLNITEARKWLEMCGSCDAGLPMSCTCPPGDIRTVLQEALAEVEQLRKHSITLNSISWRIAAALGDVPDGADSIEGDPSEQADRLIAEVERLREESDRYRVDMGEADAEAQEFRTAIERVRGLETSRIGADARVAELVADSSGESVAFYAGVAFALAKVSRALDGAE